MWITASGRLSDNVSQLTTPISSHFLIEGDVGVLVDAGISATVPRLQEEVTAYLGGPDNLKFVLLTHTHFDHIAGLPALRDWAPDAEFVASPLIAERLGDQELLQKCYERDLESSKALGFEPTLEFEQWSSKFVSDRVLGDGDALELGDGVELKFITTPGHTSDSVCYYVKPDSALVVGEALGCYGGREKIACSYMDSYPAYLESIDKLSGLDVKLISLSHNGAVTGELAQKFLVDARREAERFYSFVKERLEQGEIVEEVYNSVLPDWLTQNVTPDGPFVQSQEDCLREMIRVVAEDR